MVNWGTVESGTKPQNIEILETKVFVNTDIKEVERTDETTQTTYTIYEFNQVEYTKDEYIAALSNRTNDVEVGLVELFEQVIGG